MGRCPLIVITAAVLCIEALNIRMITQSSARRSVAMDTAKAAVATRRVMVRIIGEVTEAGAEQDCSDLVNSYVDPSSLRQANDQFHIEGLLGRADEQVAILEIMKMSWTKRSYVSACVSITP